MVRDVPRPVPSEAMTDDTPVNGGSSRGTTDVEGSAWLSVSDAAVHYDVTERTIRRWIKAGRVEATEIDTPHGPAWRIRRTDGPVNPPQRPLRVDSASTVDRVDGGSTTLDKRDRTLEFIERVYDDQAEELERLRRDNQQLAGQVGYLQRQVLEQQETIQRLLMAPKDEPANVTPDEPPAEPVRVSRWKREWGGR